MPTDASARVNTVAEEHKSYSGVANSPVLLELQAYEGDELRRPCKGRFIESLQNAKEFGLWDGTWDIMGILEQGYVLVRLVPGRGICQQNGLKGGRRNNEGIILITRIGGCSRLSCSEETRVGKEGDCGKVP